MSSKVYIADTNIISNSSKPDPHPRISAWLANQEALAIPYPVWLELENGIHKRGLTDPKKAQELRQWRDGLRNTQFYYPDMTPEVAVIHSQMMCCGPLLHLWQVIRIDDVDKPMPPNGQRQYRKPGQDLLIAALAIHYEIPIATADERDYKLIHKYFPLPGVYNPAFDTFVVPIRNSDEPSKVIDLFDGNRRLAPR